MRHINTISVAKASTNQTGSIGLDFIIWIASIVGVLKNYG